MWSGRLRQAWPGVRIHVRGDSGFGMPAMYDVCERLEIDYTIGIGMNARLKKSAIPCWKRPLRNYEATGQPQRLFTAFWYRADSWPAQRWVVVKCEANAQGTNRRAVVTNRPGAFVLPGAAYDAYADRGESENRNKELKCGLLADRLSDHRYFANLFRLYLHTAAYNLLVRMRQLVGSSASARREPEVPIEALAGRRRRSHHNRRRAHDPLGQGQPCTWRTRLIKVAALVYESTRRVVVRLSSSWPYLGHYQAVSQQVSPVPPSFSGHQLSCRQPEPFAPQQSRHCLGGKGACASIPMPRPQQQCPDRHLVSAHQFMNNPG